MLRNRFYHILVVVCPLITLFSGIALVAFLPDVAWYVAAAIAAAPVPLLYFARPSPRSVRIQQFATAFAEAPAGMMLLDLEGRVEWANNAAEKTFAQDLQTLEGRQFSELLSGEGWETIQTQRRQLLEGHRLELEGHLQLSNGESTWARCYANLGRNDWNKPAYIVIQILDMSESRSAVSVAESKFYQAMELASDLVFTLDELGRIKHCNPQASQTLTGNKDGVLTDVSIVDYVDSNHRAEFVEAFTSCQRAPETTVEIPLLRLLPGGRQNQIGAARRVAARLRSLSAAEHGVILICQDLADEGVSRDELRRSEDRFSRIFHSSPDAILILRQADSLILDFNAGFTQLLGYTREDAIGNHEAELRLFENAVERDRFIALLETTTQGADSEIKLRTKSGDTVSVEISVRYVEIDGELCMMCIGRDISERLLAEAALRESEEKFERVFTQSPDGIVILHQKDLTICDINKAFLLASGYEREELIGSSITSLAAVVHETQLAEAAKLIAQSGRFNNREMTFRAKDGSEIPALVSGTLIDLKGVPSVLCIAKDVRELRDAGASVPVGRHPAWPKPRVQGAETDLFRTLDLCRG